MMPASSFTSTFGIMHINSIHYFSVILQRFPSSELNERLPTSDNFKIAATHGSDLDIIVKILNYKTLLLPVAVYLKGDHVRCCLD